MKRYETIIIIDPDASKDIEAPIFERVDELIPQYDGFLIETDDWGTKKLAYEIKKKNRGHYVRFDFCGDGALIQEMERFFRINDRVMKFMTVLLDGDADLEAIKTELAEKEAATQAAAASETVETPTDADAPAESETPAVETSAIADAAAAEDTPTADDKKEE
ncbi:MAG: 30S ribosomal protein S6 [Proteobacteria bacterium]|nr:MAG: 30S ribosomal protein S6 [Pseudomonadota bacterium]PIE67408.1 MAG: 30S ribosomal protein S6 [Deltaproteobacteria bacterium]